MDLSENSRVWEYSALLALLIALLVMGPANIWDKNIDHGHPYGFFAQDTFIFLSYQYYLQESGSWAQLAPYLARGYADAIQSQPSVLEILSVLLANATGFGFFTTTYLIVMLLVLAAVFCVYFIVRSFNPKVALLSAPLGVMIFSPVFISAFSWGNWPFFAGSAMFVLFFWCLCRIKERWVPALGALAMAAVAFGHTSEYIFIVPVLGVLFLTDIASRQFKWEEWKRIAAMGIGSIVLAGYYIIIFIGTFMKHHEPQFLTPESTGLSMFVSITTAGTWIAVALAAGLLVGLLMLRKHRVLQIGLALFLIGFTNYIGFGKRGLETRYLWPIYLSVFFGLLIYFAATKVPRVKLTARTCAIMSILLTAALATNYYAPVDGAGLLSRQGWEAMRWVATETPQDAQVLYFFGDAYGQAGVLFNTLRLTSVILPEDYVAMAQSGQLRRTVQTERVSDRTNSYPYRKGLFRFGFHLTEDKVQIRGPEDICGFDYHVLDTVSGIQGVGQFNTAIAQQLQQNNFTVAYRNDRTIVLKNPMPGGECIA